MLMYVEMDFNTVQVLTFVVYQYMYMTNCYCNCFMFLLFYAQNWLVFDANFDSPNNQDCGSIEMSGC